EEAVEAVFAAHRQQFRLPGVVVSQAQPEEVADRCFHTGCGLAIPIDAQANYVLEYDPSRPGICAVEAEGAGALLEAKILHLLDFSQDGEPSSTLESRIDSAGFPGKQAVGRGPKDGGLA